MKTTDRGARRGLALVEVLVVLAVAFVMLALLLPAIRAAQLFQNKRAQCVNNLKQLGLALHNYHDANGVFPMSVVAGGQGHGVGHSCFTALLPYIEHAAVYNAYNFSLEPWHAVNATVTRTRLKLFLCPENKDVELKPASELKTADGKAFEGKNQFGPLHYGANWGGGRGDYGAEFVKEKGTLRGVLIPVPVMDPKTGKMTANVKLSQIRDGTSYTLAMVEKRDSFGWTVGGFGGSEFDVHTAPNYDGDDAMARRVYTGSAHAGGVNGLMTDGSVRFYTDKTEKSTWYALMTRDGGEVVKLDR